MSMLSAYHLTKIQIVVFLVAVLVLLTLLLIVALHTATTLPSGLHSLVESPTVPFNRP